MRTKLASSVLVLAALLSGCTGGGPGSGEGSNGPEQVDTVEARPRMEQVLDSYEAMEREMIAAVEAELPGLQWRMDTEDTGMTRSLCDGAGLDDDAEEVDLATLWAPGTLAPADWPRAVELVQEVGDRYGFTERRTVVDEADDLEVVGEDEYGGRYRFGMAANTILSVRTGCHLWERLPAEGEQRPSPLEG
ncbi:LppA family lipoprotein [Cellulosimicrobium cellulans]|uniref:LppA family lipoprotein n=1 Tax=Cellulosimicrobium cellulans TaxID=1710 RepID=UPI00165220A9|nr:LppA family lipoprotein [Cellulosimicrobium cellulans]